jgi:thiol-disulfide isomerase/thioredoxin
MTLDTMQPTPTFDATAHEDTIETLAEHDDLTYLVWGGDWCKDCRAALPDFAAALDAAGVPDEQIEHYPVEREESEERSSSGDSSGQSPREHGEKVGPRVEEYDIELIPTIVAERDGKEVARFVEEEDRPAAVHVAEQLDELEASA